MNIHQSYEYNCTDKSILLPFVKKYHVALVHQWIPDCITPNMITVFSSMSMWVALLISVFFWGNITIYLLISILFLLYVYLVGDILDGMRAKATSSSSMSGEYLDHGLDAYNASIAVVICFSAFNISSIFYLLSSVWFIQFTFLCTMLEQKLKNKIYFGMIGNLEALVFIMIILLGMLSEVIKNYLQQGYIMGLPVTLILLALSFAAPFLQTIGILKRISPLHPVVVCYVLFSILLICSLIYLPLPRLMSFFILFFYCGEFANRLIFSHITKSTSISYPDFIVPIILLTLNFYYSMYVNTSFIVALAWVITGYLVIKSFLGICMHYQYLTPRKYHNFSAI